MLEKISLITSLYRSEKHLALYGQRVQEVAARLNQAELPYEIIVIANDLTEAETHHLKLIEKALTSHIHIFDVPRETLYASWNRGVELAKGDIIGFWNVDDNRTSEGIIEAHRLLTSGLELVDLPYYVAHPGKSPQLVSNFYMPTVIAPKHCLGTFFMFKRELFEAAGAFNENFRIAGDFEWGARQRVREAIYGTTDVIGGDFILHQDNLSNRRNAMEWVEINVVLLWHGLYNQIRPVDPALMQQVWEDWGHRGGTLPKQVAEWLWGAKAQARYRHYERERAAPSLLRRLRLALAQRGFFPSVEWDVHHKTEYPVDWDV